MKFIIIGAGWYGCHIASILKEQNKEIIIVDKMNDFFCGSSSKNQNRLHNGFHYPRSESTIKECKEGYNNFLNRYKSFITNIPRNIYYISRINSRVSFDIYLNNMDNNDVSYNLLNTSSGAYPFIMDNIEDKCISTKELYIDHRKAAAFFKQELQPYMCIISDPDVFHSIDSIKQHLNITCDDIVINCTYNHLNPIPYESYELFLSLIYKIDNIDLFAMTIMDGCFFSIFPYDISNNLYTLTSVKHGIIYTGRNKDIQEISVSKVREEIEVMVDTFILNWRDHMTYVDHFTSWKTKPQTTTDDRSARIERDGNTISIYGGKITGIFAAEKYVASVFGI